MKKNCIITGLAVLGTIEGIVCLILYNKVMELDDFSNRCFAKGFTVGCNIIADLSNENQKVFKELLNQNNKKEEKRKKKDLKNIFKGINIIRTKD